jgi:hypothetical protein
MAAYATFSYYTGTYLGNVIASADFSRLALRASAIIDQITFNRAAAIITANTPAATVTAIQNATCAVAEQYQANEANGNADGIQAEGIGSNSVTYNEKASSQLSNHEKLVRAAKVYLGNTSLMFPGFESGEYGGMPDAD